jgi:hypothetical protein
VSEYGNITCIGGSRGLLCSGCDGGYFKEASTGNCVKCGNWAAEQTPLVIVLVFLLVTMGFRLWWKCTDDSDHQHRDFKHSITTTASNVKLVALKFMENL